MNHHYTYHDHSNSNDEEDDATISTKGGLRAPFPEIVFYMLQYIDLYEPELGQIISWQPHGRAFRVHNIKAFETYILPKVFKHNKYSSFRRQLNLWGFKRLFQKSTDNGAYYHELFLRSKVFLHHHIRRDGGKSDKEARNCFRVPPNHGEEPNFSSMRTLPPSSERPRHHAGMCTLENDSKKAPHERHGTGSIRSSTTRSETTSGSSSFTSECSSSGRSHSSFDQSLEEEIFPKMLKQEYQEGSFGVWFPSVSVLDAEIAAILYIEETKFNTKYADLMPLPDNTPPPTDEEWKELKDFVKKIK